jgi:hypothetical protein
VSKATPKHKRPASLTGTLSRLAEPLRVTEPRGLLLWKCRDGVWRQMPEAVEV